MRYLTTGQRSRCEVEYLLLVRQWCKALRISPPTVRVKSRLHGLYKSGVQRIVIGGFQGAQMTDRHVDALIHECAHHVAARGFGQHGHGPAFRIALVQIITVAKGDLLSYGWEHEYQTIVSWARRHGILPPPSADA